MATDLTIRRERKKGHFYPCAKQQKREPDGSLFAQSVVLLAAATYSAKATRGTSTVTRWARKSPSAM